MAVSRRMPLYARACMRYQCVQRYSRIGISAKLHVQVPQRASRLIPTARVKSFFFLYILERKKKDSSLAHKPKREYKHTRNERTIKSKQTDKLDKFGDTAQRILCTILVSYIGARL